MKKSLKIIIAVSAATILAALSVLCYLLVYHPELFDPALKKPEDIVWIDTHNYFYEAEYAEDITDMTEYETYEGYDRLIHYKDGALTIAIQDSNRGSIDKEVLFFEDYFDIIISGNAEEYNKLFTEEYFKTHEKKEKFTPQMVYDMEIENKGTEELDGVKYYAFDVSYKIFRNNGTFRDDVYSDASNTLYMVITQVDGEYKINQIMDYVPAE